MDNLTQEETQKHISALHDSVYEINKVIGEADNSEFGRRRLSANFLHLELMLSKDWLIVSDSDKAIFLAAIASGREFFELNS